MANSILIEDPGGILLLIQLCATEQQEVGYKISLVRLKQGQLIHYFESWAYFFAMNNPFVELPDVRLKKMLNSVCETK